MRTKQETVQYLCDHVFGNYTLETQNSDEKDFHNVAVWTIKEGIEKAYDFGKESLVESLAWTLSVCEELLRDGNEQEQYLMRKARKALEGAK
jgi:hypothetical protein